MSALRGETSTQAEGARAPVAILVLGARVRSSGAPGRALSRRIAEGARAAARWPEARVVACGGRAWDGIVEADVIVRELVAAGVDPARIERDRMSLTTIENLREGSARAGSGPLAIVTCAWHLDRALAIARVMRLEAIGVPAAAHAPVRVRVRERILRAIVPLLVVTAIVACRRAPTPATTDAGALATSASAASSGAAPATSAEVIAARVAADRRNADEVPASLSTSADPLGRRAAARALAQIGDAAAIERLGRSLADDDHEVVAWSAYGLGVPCDVDVELAREQRLRIVHALVARAITLEERAVHGGLAFDPWSAIGWSLGRCGGIESSRELARWLPKGGARAQAAAWALGAIAARDRGLEDDVAHALVDAAKGGDAGAPLDDALFPFGRGDWGARPPVHGLAEAARARLGASGPGRVFAIRALGRASGAKVEDLRPIVADEKAREPERIEALRALHRLGEAGDAEIAAFVTRNLAGQGVSPTFGALRVAIDLLSERAPTKTTITSLRAIGGAPIAAGTSPAVARRLATLRCAAALAVSAGKPGEAELVRCAAHDPSLPAGLRAELDTIRDLARLGALDRTGITGDKRDLLLRFASTGAPRVRERALAIAAKHPEVEEAPEVIAKALAAKSLGVVSAAAQALADRPSLAHVLSKKAIAQALDPSAPPPEQVEPEKALDDKVLKALDAAIARPMEDADAETKLALAAAVAATKRTKSRPFLMRLCGDRVPALRKAARDALARLDPPGKAPACSTIEDHGAASPYAATAPAAKTLKLDTDAGALTLALDPTFAPVAVARIAELAASGFYDGAPIHRVVPGFVVQLGDPDGDGYGGAHVALRCETAPAPFAEGDVGVALAGRDTGSSQLFVMLGRAPHLDGSYAWIGKASGPWSSVAEGDVITKASVTDP